MYFDTESRSGPEEARARYELLDAVTDWHAAIAP
jgi:hypothetical protein